jgi:GT2 family glycosyltransferase
MSIAISIINYNSKELLRPLLKNLLSQKINGAEIWVVDNNSPDNGKEMIKKEFKQVHLIESGENGGFAKGHNLVLKKIKTELVLLLNPDTKIPNGAIEQMIKFMTENPNCDISSCKIINSKKTLDSNGGDLPEGGPLLSWLFNLEMVPGLEKIFGNFHREDSKYYENVHQVGWVGGTFMMIRSSVFKKIGFLPEEYFMYFEDSDFCYQAHKKNIPVMINPKVTIEHIGGASSVDPRFSQFKGEMKGLQIFYLKEFGFLAYVLVRLLIYLGTFLRIIAFAIIGKTNIAKTYGRVITAI